MISNLINKLVELDKYLDTEYKKARPTLRDVEIKLFFLLRHYDATDVKTFIPLQQFTIDKWEPRVANLIQALSTNEYAKLRPWLGINDLNLGAFNAPQKLKLPTDTLLKDLETIIISGRVHDASSAFRAE